MTLIALAAGAVLLAVTFAYYFVFSRPMSLDEGYLMITVQGFLSGHALYDTVFTQYGPFYYFYQWLIRSVLMVPLTHDATRMLCIVHWLGASLLVGFAVRRMTASGFAGLFSGLVSFAHLSALAYEPGHPQEIVVVLLAAGVFASTFWPRRGALPTVAAIAVLLAFTKINVGLFLGFAVAIAIACRSTGLFARPALRVAMLALAAAMPFLLMRNHLPAGWCVVYATIIAATAVATMYAAQRMSIVGSMSLRDWFGAILAVGITGMLLAGGAIATGTTPAGMLDGLLLSPLRMPRVALLPLQLPTAAVTSAVLSVAAAIYFFRSGRHQPQSIAAFKAAFGLVGIFVLLGQPKLQLGWLLPWVWLAAVPLTAQSSPEQAFARLFLCVAACWQGLQGYPIAGSQVAIATVLLTAAFGVCLSDAVRFISTAPLVVNRLLDLSPVARRIAPALAGVALLFVFSNVWCKLPAARAEYSNLPRLSLPGSLHVRMDTQTAENYQALTVYLASESDTFVCYPGVNSLYFWTGKRPPTQLNCTGWGMLTSAQQGQIIEAVSNAQRPKIVVAEAQMAGWNTPLYDPIRPFIRYVAEQCRPVKRIGRFLVFEPKAAMLSQATD